MSPLIIIHSADIFGVLFNVSDTVLGRYWSNEKEQGRYVLCSQEAMPTQYSMCLRYRQLAKGATMISLPISTSLCNVTAAPVIKR